MITAEYLEAMMAIEMSEGAFDRVVEMVQRVRRENGCLFFIGNGGSAAIASHMAADFQKAAKVRAMCFNDGPSLTALANDCGYHQVFSQPLRMHGKSGDVLFAISSSGNSASILNAVWCAVDAVEADVITLSGFDRDNALRRRGDIDFYVPSHRYGVVETAHLAICHTILDRVAAE